MDLKEIILGAEAIKNNFKSKKYDSSKLADDLLFISEPIMNNKANSQSNIQQYTAITSNAVEKLKNGAKLSQDEFDQWTTGFYQLLSLIYINMSLNDTIDKTSDDELDELLFNALYFDDQLGNITRFFASFNFAKKDPMRCYNSVMSAFEKHPDLITSFLANRKYVYDRKKSMIRYTRPVLSAAARKALLSTV